MSNLWGTKRYIKFSVLKGITGCCVITIQEAQKALSIFQTYKRSQSNEIMTLQETMGLQNTQNQVSQQFFRAKMNWALLRGLGWGSLSSPVPPHSMDRVELSQTRHWAGGRAHTQSLAAGPAFPFILFPSALWGSQSHVTVSVWFFSLLVLKKDGISLNRSSSPLAQPHYGFTQWPRGG